MLPLPGPAAARTGTGGEGGERKKKKQFDVNLVSGSIMCVLAGPKLSFRRELVVFFVS